jgi:hypothetical protein
MALSFSEVVSKVEAVLPKVSSGIAELQEVLAVVDEFPEFPAEVKADLKLAGTGLDDAAKVVAALEGVLAKL